MFPSTDEVELPSVGPQFTPFRPSFDQETQDFLQSLKRSETLDRTFGPQGSRRYSTFAASSSIGGGGPEFPPSPPRQGRLDALEFLQQNFPTPTQGEQILVGHVVGRGIDQFASSLPSCMQDSASGSIGKHYREDVSELLKLPATDQNLMLLACVETVHWNQENQTSGNMLGSSMTAADRASILINAKNLDNDPPWYLQGMKVAMGAAFAKSGHVWEPISNTAGLKPEQQKLFKDISNEVTEMAASLSMNGVVDVKALGDSVTKCAQQSGNDPSELLKLLKEKNDALKLEFPEKEVTLEKAKNLELKSGYTLGSAMGKPVKPAGPSQRMQV